MLGTRPVYRSRDAMLVAVRSVHAGHIKVVGIV